jgi:hypothetical protein
VTISDGLAARNASISLNVSSAGSYSPLIYYLFIHCIPKLLQVDISEEGIFSSMYTHKCSKIVAFASNGMA